MDSEFIPDRKESTACIDNERSNDCPANRLVNSSHIPRINTLTCTANGRTIPWETICGEANGNRSTIKNENRSFGSSYYC